MLSDKKLSEVRAFFKTRVFIQDTIEALDQNPSGLVGVDNVSSKALISKGINNIGDLANLSVENPPEITGIPKHMLLKWIKTAQLLKKVISDQIKEDKKLIVVGLDNGGKTSLLEIIQNKFTKNILPTKGVKRDQLNLFGFRLITWDLGGQVQFRENWYFQKPELYFSEASLMIYVIDIQDIDRFDESVVYFQGILNVLHSLGEYIPIMIVFNKCDPDVINTPNWQNSVQMISDKLNQILSLHQGIDFDYSMTSIYNKESIIQMFSTALKKISETGSIIDQILEELANSVNARTFSLISSEGLIFGTYTKNEADESILNNMAIQLQALELFCRTKGLNFESVITHEMPANNLIIRGDLVFNHGPQNTPVYLWILSQRYELIESRLASIKQELIPLVQLFL